MRAELDQLTQGQWIQLKNESSSTEFKKLLRIAKAGGIEVPACVGIHNYSPKLVFLTLSETARYDRVKDTDATNKFNAETANWSTFVTAELRSEARMRFPDSKDGKSLADTIHGNIRYDKKYKIEVQSLGFSFARHGVYLHYGASRGYGGYVGSKWKDKNGNLHVTNPNSLGKMNSGARKAVHWFNPVLKKHLPTLADIAAEYCLDMTININALFLEE